MLDLMFMWYMGVLRPKEIVHFMATLSPKGNLLIAVLNLPL